MSSYVAPTYHPHEKRVRDAWWLDDYFGKHRYGVRFDDGGHVFRPEEVKPPVEREVKP
jgi:hypothetical protein